MTFKIFHGSYIATCGFDGEAKVFKGFKDEHPSVFLIGEVVYAVQIQVMLYLTFCYLC